VLRHMLAARLEAKGHEVIACESGEEAWAVLAHSNPPVVITDWSMPGMSGIELTQRVRKTPRDSYVYVIMLTSNDSRNAYLTGVDAGVDAFLAKPLDPGLMEAQLIIAARIVGLQQHTRQLESIMTVCSYCKRVRGAEGWENMERFVAREFKTLPSHTYCPTCFAEKVEPEMRALGLPTDDLDLH
jgi:sigma-B regulation protein RsbU (phosphoserine phosphatase)